MFDCSGPLMGELKAGNTVTLDSGAVVSSSFTADIEQSFLGTGNNVFVHDLSAFDGIRYTKHFCIMLFNIGITVNVDFIKLTVFVTVTNSWCDTL